MNDLWAMYLVGGAIFGIRMCWVWDEMEKQEDPVSLLFLVILWPIIATISGLNQIRKGVQYIKKVTTRP